MSERIKQTPCEANITISTFTPNVSLETAFEPISFDDIKSLLEFEGIHHELVPSPKGTKVRVDCVGCQFNGGAEAVVFGSQESATHDAILTAQTVVRSVCKKGDTATLPIDIFRKDNYKMDDSLLPPTLQPKPIASSPQIQSFLNRLIHRFR